MTHPDILKMERLGALHPEPTPEYLGNCAYCGAALYSGSPDLLRSADGRFCDMDCCRNYYEIEEL